MENQLIHLYPKQELLDRWVQDKQLLGGGCKGTALLSAVWTAASQECPGKCAEQGTGRFRMPRLRHGRGAA